MKKIIYTFILLLPLLLFGCASASQMNKTMEKLAQETIENKKLNNEITELNNQIQNFENENKELNRELTELKYIPPPEESMSLKTLNTTASKLLRLSDYENSFKYFIEAAKKNDPYSQTMVGIFFINDWFLGEEDYEEAVRWLELASTQNYAYAQSLLATLYARGLGVNQDFEKSFELHKLAAENDSEQSKSVLRFLGADFTMTHEDTNALDIYSFPSDFKKYATD